jgi:hypothetical protein
MANYGSPGRRAGVRRMCGAVTRVYLVTVLVAAMLCSASYCLGIWHNSRGATDSRVLGPSVTLADAATCGGDGPLDFEAHHSAERAGLSVSSSSGSTSTRRTLRGAAPGGGTDLEYRSAFTRWTAGDWWAGLVGGGSFRFAGAVRA